MRHTLWVIRDAARSRRLTARLRRHAGALHRRRPPPLRRRLARRGRARAAEPSATGDESYNCFLARDLPAPPDAASWTTTAWSRTSTA
ncbi:MAG: hypothetical protein MZW92_43325 [Comamonadaceae bacterium]|nr:hypothetical protein [Comamonadaceae bacterium]